MRIIRGWIEQRNNQTMNHIREIGRYNNADKCEKKLTKIDIV